MHLHLQKNPDRKFIYVEQAFFQHWYFSQDESTRAEARALFANGQLEFTNGGWCMHDEANPTYVDMIDQTTLGSRYLLQEFGSVPSVTWQIDPFGHSATQQSEQTALSGYDSIYFARIDYQDKAKRSLDKSLEMMWRADPSLGATAQSFTGVLYFHYCPPPGLNFDLSNNGATPININSRLEGIQPGVQAIVDTFVKDAAEQAAAYKGGHIAFTMGCDFQYEQAGEWYENLDALIHLINANGSVNVFYSTPEQYTRAKAESAEEWPLKTDDFMPYADTPYAYWSGYFTSRPSLKGYVRTSSAYLQAARALMLNSNATSRAAESQQVPPRSQPSTRDYVLPQTGDGSDALPAWFGSSLGHLEHAMGTAQHHDAVSGTEQQHVAFDYAKKLSAGHQDAQAGTNEMMTQVTRGASGWAECELANVTICQPLMKRLATALAIVNSRAQSTNVQVRLPVSVSGGDAGWSVSNATAHTIAAQLTATSERDLQLAQLNGVAANDVAWLNFQVKVPAYGFTTVFLEPSSLQGASSTALAGSSTKPRPRARNAARAAFRGSNNQDIDIVLDNGFISVTVSGRTGMLAHAANKHDNISMDLAAEWRWYNSSTGNACSGQDCPWGTTQASGAYIFRPNTTSAQDFAVGPVSARLVSNGPVVWEVQHSVGEWVTAVTRLWAGSAAIEVEYTVGPIPIQDGLGKEVVHRISTNVQSGDKWSTDSNGRAMQLRQRNHRPSWTLNVTNPIAGNYYPVNAALRIEEHGVNARALSMLNDRSQGGSSLQSGQAELMVHRRMLVDDGRGVGQALNESGLSGQGLIVRGRHWLLVTSASTAAVATREQQQAVYFAPMVKLAPTQGLSPQQWAAKFAVQRAGVSAALPRNVHLLTVDPANYGPGRALVRLAHLYAVGEDAAMSAPANVSLANLFTGLTITYATEVNLRGNQDVAAANPLRWRVQGEGAQPLTRLQQWALAPPAGDDLQITLQPMDIRTFLVQFG